MRWLLVVFFEFLPFRFSDQGVLHIYYFTRLGLFMYGTIRMFAVFESTCPILKFDVHQSSTVRDWLYSIFRGQFIHGGRAVPYWRRYTLIQLLNIHRKKSVFQIKVLPHCRGEPQLCSRFSYLLRAEWFGVWTPVAWDFPDQSRPVQRSTQPSV